MRTGAGRDDAVAGHDRRLLAGCIEQHAEFVATQTRDDRPLGRLRVEDAAHFADQRVACEVAQRVVDDLEPVEIEHRGREQAGPLGAITQRAQEGEPVGRIGQRIVRRHMDRAAFVRSEFGALLLELDDLGRELLPRRSQFAIDLPAMRQRGRGLDDLRHFERLGDVEDLVRRPCDLADLDRRKVGKAGDDAQVDLGIERADAARGFTAVDARRHAHVDERDRIGRPRRQRRLHRRDRVEALMAMRQVEAVVRRRIRRRRVVAEQLRRHRVERILRSTALHREAAGIAVVHGRLVIDDQQALRNGGGHLQQLPSYG